MKKYFKNIIFVWTWFKTEKLKMSIALFWIIWVSITSTVSPIFYKKIIDIATNESISKQTRIDNLIWIFVILAGLYIMNQVFWRTLSISQSLFELKVREKLAKHVFSYMNGHSFRFFSDNMTWSLIKKYNRFIWAMSNLSAMIAYDLWTFFVSMILSFVVIFYENIYLWLAYVAYIVIFILTWLFFNKSLIKARNDFNDNDSKMGWFVADVITNNFNLTIFSKQEKEFGSFKTKMAENTWLLKKLYFSFEYFFGIMWTLFVISELAIYFIAVKLWWFDIITIWTLVLLISYQSQIWIRIFNMPFIIRRLAENMSDIEEIITILEKPHDILDKTWAKNLEIKKWEIVFENVDFKYFEWQEEVISKLSLTIKPWEKVALVWVSGSGKSTIIKLILRLYDLSSGKIFIDGQDISDVSQESLRNSIWLVPQEPVLFHRTLAENISYGKDDATQEEIIKVAKEAECHKFISKQEKGYDTLVWERWIKLSGWERQRVAIARILLKNAKILLLDEATSALDSESEILIQKAIDKAMKWKTTIAIAHRLSTIMKMDRIVVLEKWRIVEDWTHGELLAKNDWIYKKLWEIQSGGFIGE